MSICASGASQPVPGLSDFLIIGTPYLASILEPLGAAWVPFVYAMGAELTLNLPAFCAADPPADPGVSAADLLAVASAAPEFFDPGARTRVLQLLERYAWYSVCQCTSGTTPAPPAAPSLPSGAPSVNPPSIVSNPVSGGCGAVQSAVVNPPGPAGPHVGIVGTVDPVTNLATTPAAVPTGATTLEIDYITQFVAADNRGNHNYSLLWYNAAGGLISAIGPTTQNTATTVHHSFTVPAGTVSWSLSVTDGTAGGGFPELNMSATGAFYCGGGLPGQASVACCIPDPIATGLLNTILQMVTLIQRQIAPFATVHGATHAGLSGNGQLAVQGLIGVAVDITTLPARAGRVSGDPQSIWEVGWIQTGTADGWGPRHFISSDPFVLSPVAGDVTLVGYSIPADTVVTITELVREP